MSALRIDFTPKYLPILDVFRARQDIRYYLCGVYVEKAPQGGVYLIGCDGHTMAIVYDKHGVIEGADSAIFTVDPGLVAAAKQAEAKKSKKLPYAVMVRGQRAMVAVPDADDLELFIQPGRCLIEGAFPKWRTVLPDFDKLKPGAALGQNGVNATYMARFSKVITDKRHQGMSFWQENSEKPLVVQIDSLPEAVFIVMPMRGDMRELQFKHFLPPKEEPVALAEAA